jgi:hypothetical protein
MAEQEIKKNFIFTRVGEEMPCTENPALTTRPRFVSISNREQGFARFEAHDHSRVSLVIPHCSNLGCLSYHIDSRVGF